MMTMRIKRSLYQELLAANNSIKGDKKLHFIEAYENFARRCMVQEAIRFSALVIQYMKDGSDQYFNPSVFIKNNG